MSCKDFLFKGDNILEYIGNGTAFDEIYKNIEDPWNQTDNEDEYYNSSRKIISSIITQLTDENKEINILEVGCGHGFSTFDLEKKINIKNINYHGCDISKVAIEKAKSKYKNIKFFTHDIKNKFNGYEKYDFIIISNLLWYILDHLEVSINNCFNSLSENGKIIFYSAFIRDQRYGKEIINGFGGMKKFLLNKFPDKEIIKEIDGSNENKNYYRYLGLFVLCKKL